jgi:hypothetical protein
MINSATLPRLARIGEALDLRFVPLFIPEKSVAEIEPRIRKLIPA